MKEYIDLEELFEKHGWTWSITGEGRIVPNSSDIESAIDEAARVLYDKEVGAILEVGRLVIIKQANGLDVYVLAGEYNKENND